MKSNDFDILEALWLRREKKRRAQKIIEGALPLTYTAKKAGTLKNYRIYGQTVDGESVGDRTANLFDENGVWVNGCINDNGELATNDSIATYTKFINVKPDTDYSFLCDSSVPEGVRFNFYDSSKNFISRLFRNMNNPKVTTPSTCEYITLSVNKNQIQYLMIIEGSTAPTEYEPYGYKVPVTVEGKNLFDNSKTANILKCYLSVSALVSSVNTRTIFIECKPSTTYTVSKMRGKRFVVGWSDKLPAPGVELQEKVINYSGSSITITTGLAAKYLVAYIYNAEQDAPITADEMIASVQIEEGTAATTYEPYRTPVTTPIYLPEPIRKVGNEAEYIDYAEQKQHFADGTSADVTLPALPTIAGTNTLTVGTQVQPSKVMVRGKISQE